MLNRPELAAALKPNLDKPPQLEDVMRAVGIDPTLYRDERGRRSLRVRGSARAAWLSKRPCSN